MKTLISIFSCFLFFSLASLAQEATFKVVAVKGRVSTNNQPITQNSEIKLPQSISIADDSSYICLISNDKKEILEVSKKGSYQMADLQKQIPILDTSYSKLVIHELFYPKEVVKKFSHMNKTGRVPHRHSFIIPVLPDARVALYNNKMTIKWHLIGLGIEDMKQIHQYKVMIFTLNDILLFEEKTPNMYMIIDLSKTKKLMKEKLLILKIVPLDKSGKELENQVTVDGDAIVRMEESEKQQIIQELNAICKDQNRETAFAKLVEARFFEDKELYIDAINAYEEMRKFSFVAESYKKAYRFFLKRNGFWMGGYD